MVVKGEIEEDSSRNLLQCFGGRISVDWPPEVAGGGDTCEVELSLGLSLNGCFGVEPKEKRLIRSSSISSFSIFPIEHNVQLMRTCSLPAETEEERTKRKEMESFKRMEAKRKRSEKKAAKDRKDENFEEDSNNLRNNNSKGEQVFVGKMKGVVVNGEVGRWVKGKGVNGGGRLASQGSIGSQGSSSSSVSDFESKQVQGVDVSVLPISCVGVDMSGVGNCTEVRSSSTTILLASNHTNQKVSTTANITTILSASNHANQKASTTASITRVGDEPSKKCCRTNRVKESERNMMGEMPCVSTKGDGPNGRRIEGFLYKYRKEGEVRIVCVCHGQFLTPAEFVKHAGGGDVAHPLRHIVVNPTPALL